MKRQSECNWSMEWSTGAMITWSYLRNMSEQRHADTLQTNISYDGLDVYDVSVYNLCCVSSTIRIRHIVRRYSQNDLEIVLIRRGRQRICGDHHDESEVWQ